MKKIISQLRNAKGKITMVFVLAMALIVNSVSFVFASTTTDFSAVQSALTSKFTVAEISALIASVIGATVGFALLWFGARKLVRAIISAFKTGKIKF